MIYTNNTITNTALTNQCPLICGTAVYNAHAIINSYYPTIEFDSDSICQIAGYRNENKTDETVKSFLNADFTIYPIPIYDNLIIENVMQCQYEIFDIVGMLHIQGNITSNRNTINISELADGIYILKLLKTDGTESCIKVIKAK